MKIKGEAAPHVVIDEAKYKIKATTPHLPQKKKV